uniref:Uncharacterized protein n=1 Tax=Caenorhabditis japonica TaxID=281687 RepID=A0A8R1I2M3_CAEJA
MSAASIDEQLENTEIRTAIDGPYSDAGLRTAVNSTLRSRTGATTRTAKGTRSSASNASQSPNVDKMVSAFASISLTYLFLAVQTYTDFVVSIFHLAYFSYRNPAISKDLIKTAFHLLKTSYDNKLLTLYEIYETTNNSIIKPMARQNQQNFQEETHRTTQLETMRTSAVSQQ